MESYWELCALRRTILLLIANGNFQFNFHERSEFSSNLTSTLTSIY